MDAVGQRGWWLACSVYVRGGGGEGIGGWTCAWAWFWYGMGAHTTIFCPKSCNNISILCVLLFKIFASAPFGEWQACQPVVSKIRDTSFFIKYALP